LLLNECLLLFFRYRLSPETFGYTLVQTCIYIQDVSEADYSRLQVIIIILSDFFYF